MKKARFRAWSILGITFLLAACSIAPVSPTPPSSTPQVGAWKSDRGATQILTLTLFDDGRAELRSWGPPKSIDHWGELEIPEESETATVRRVGDRTFLIFEDETPRFMEIAERGRDHLAVWFYAAGFDTDAKTDSNLLALPGATTPPDMEFTLVPEPKSPAEPRRRAVPSTRFAI